MIDYRNKYRLKTIVLQVLDLFLMFFGKRVIYSSFSIEAGDEPKIAILQTTFDAIGKHKWILCGITQSSFMNSNYEYFIVYKKVGYFEYRFYNKISKERTLNYIKDLTALIADLKKQSEQKSVGIIEEIKKLKMNKNKNLKKIFGEEDSE